MSPPALVRLAVVVASCALLGGCHSGSPAAAHAQSAADADAVTYEVAAPMEMERGSYQKSQRDKYNRIYSQPESERPQPNEFLVQCLQRIAAQRERERKHERADDLTAQAVSESSEVGSAPLMALDAGMGDGRNTIALAQHGYQTFGFDFSDVGVNRARKRAAELGLTIDAQVDVYSDRYIQPKSWDVLALMYFGFSPYDNAERRERVKNSVKPGGYIIYESPGGVNNDVLRCFMDWEIIVYEMDWGNRQWEQGRPVTDPGKRTRLLVRRPLEPEVQAGPDP